MGKVTAEKRAVCSKHRLICCYRTKKIIQES